MKIILSHEEFIELQRIKANLELEGYPLDKRPLQRTKTLLALAEAGLIKSSWFDTPLDEESVNFYPITITPLGATVLRAHEPWVGFTGEHERYGTGDLFDRNEEHLIST